MGRGSESVNGLDKVALFSNYAWAYTASATAKKYFPHNNITLITTNVKDVVKKHDFKMDVIELPAFSFKDPASIIKMVRLLKRMSFNTVIIDYGFNLNTAFLLLSINFQKIFIIDWEYADILRPITKRSFLKILAGKMPYFINKMLIQLSKSLRMSISLGLPSEISIETTTICNLKCKACPTGLGQLNRMSTHISRDLFDHITSYSKSNFKYFDIVFPFIFGEPLSNKDIFYYIKELRRISPPYTRLELHTNGNISNSTETARRLLGAGLDLINISVDGTEKIAYESFRKGGNFELVCDFVKNLAAAKKEMGLLKPEIVVQMIVTKYSEDQVDGANKFKDSLGADRLLLKGYFYEFTGLSDEEGYSIAPSKKELVHGKDKKKNTIERKKNLCGWAYRAISIMCNGNVTPCCIDYNTSLLGGLNIKDTSIRKIWNSKKYRRFRRNMLNGKNQICNKCFFS